MRIALLSSLWSKDAVDQLREHCDQIVRIEPSDSIDAALAGHPDIQLCPIDDKTVVVHPHMGLKTIEELGHFGVIVRTGTTFLSKDYPGDIPYNVAVAARYFFHLEGHTDPVCREELERRGLRFVPVKQGYSKCSSLIIGEEHLVSADPTICRKAREAGLYVLQIPPGDIQLPGMKYGFIGGATGVLNEEKQVFFYGDWRSTSWGHVVEAFIQHIGYECISLNSGPLIDVGGLFFLHT